jgi:hypothetical protein
MLLHAKTKMVGGRSGEKKKKRNKSIIFISLRENKSIHLCLEKKTGIRMSRSVRMQDFTIYPCSPMLSTVRQPMLSTARQPPLIGVLRPVGRRRRAKLVILPSGRRVLLAAAAV